MVRKEDVEDIFRLTPNQEALLVHHIQAGIEDGGFIQIKSGNRGKLDVEVWNKAWRLVIQNIPTLRTSLHWEKLKHPVQVIHKKFLFKVDYRDLRSASLEESERSFSGYLEQDKQVGLALSECPPMRFALFHLPGESYRYVWTCHHALMDGWSGAIVLNSVLKTYNYLLENKPVSLPPSPPFKNYVSWLQKCALSHSAREWQLLLQGLYPGKAESSFPLLPFNSSDTGVEFFTSTQSCTNDLSHFFKSQGITQSTMFSTAWGLLLSIVKEEETSVFGITVNGRTAPVEGIESMVGMFSNAIPCPVRCASGSTVDKWLHANRETQLRLQEVDFITSGQINQWLGIAADQPLFDSLVVYTNYPVEVEDNESSSLDGRITSKYPLTATIKSADTITLHLTYHRSVFDRDWVVKLGKSFLKLLEILPHDLQQELNDLKDQIAKDLPRYQNPGNQKRFSSTLTAPRNQTETSLLNIWKALFQKENLGTEDNFFELGGHSLTAVQLMGRIQSLFDVSLSFMELFDSPTISKLAEKVVALTQGTRNPLPPITPVPRDKPLPLSFAQQRLWFIDQLQGSTPEYNMPLALQLEGELDPRILEKSINSVIERHESLRTRFVKIDGEPRQEILPSLTIEIKVLDPQSDDGKEPGYSTADVMTAIVNKPFNLAAGPLIRATLIRNGDQNFILLLVCHHIIGDGSSWRILTHELGEYYEALVNNREVELAPLEIQYADFSVWQRNWQNDSQLRHQIDYWRKKLADASALELSLDHTRPEIQSHKGKNHRFSLNPETCRTLDAFVKRERVTHFMAFLGVFQSLLYRYSLQKDILIGAPLASRNQTSLESQIGFFINNLVIRSDLSADLGFRDVVQGVRDAVLEALEYQDLPFEKLVEELNPRRDMSRHPVFQVTLSVQKESFVPEFMGSVRITHLELPVSTVHFDLELYFWMQRDEWAGSISYNTDLFEPSTIERMAGHFVSLLESMIQAPDRPISEATLLTKNEIQTLRVDWNNTDKYFPGDPCIFELFEEQVEKKPHAIALVHKDDSFTYRQLNERANWLACHLRNLGVGPEVIVGICLERSLELMVAMLAVSKAGGAYVPLDPHFPAERLKLYFEDCNASVLLSQHSSLDLCKSFVGPVVLMEDWQGNVEPQNPKKLTFGNHSAYIIYTSGSTGKPKGVVIEHRSAVNLLQVTKQRPGILEDDVMLAVATFSFDASVMELFAPLCVGARLVLLPDSMRSDPVQIANLIKDCGATVMEGTPSLWKMLLLSGWSGEPNLKVLAGGEALTAELVSRMLPRCREFWNLYGPTEATVNSLVGRIYDPESISIGKPVENATVYIVDPNNQLVPVGIPGELLIGGVGLARGYHGNQALTEERFIKNPFSQKQGSRVYRSGDLCKWLPDGSIACLGRIDNQVKIRGYRIELGEIDYRVKAFPGVKDCATIVSADSEGDKRLISFIISSTNGDEPKPADLKEFLRLKLPEYMVPAAFIFLDSFPLTPSGKIDLKSIPIPEITRDQSDLAYTAPSNPTEKTIAGIWAAVLKVKNPGAHDNFFELGGHSMIAIQVISRIQVEMQVDVPISELFRSSTIAGLARYILSQNKAKKNRIETIKEARPPSKPNLDKPVISPVTRAQYRIWFIRQLEGKTTSYNISLNWRISGPLNVDFLRKTLETIVTRHEPYRTQIKELEGEPIQVIQPPGPLKILKVDLTTYRDEEQERELEKIIYEEYDKDFDLSSDLMLRVTLVNLAREEFALLLTQHHIASDGWSSGILKREISSLYNAFCRGEEPILKDLPIRYSEFITKQEQKLNDEKRSDLIKYWKDRLNNITHLELPSDHPRPTQLSKRGAGISESLDPLLVGNLRQLSRSCNATLQSTLTSAFILLLSRLSGQTDIVVGVPSAGRSALEAENLIGYFLNTLVLREDTSKNPRFTEFLDQVQETTLAALDHQDLPFDTLVDALQPVRDLSRNPLYQILINIWEEKEDQLFQLDGLTIHALETTSAHNKFDLTLYIGIEGNNVSVELVYSTDLFEEERMKIMLEQFSGLLAQIAENPSRSLSDYSLLTTELGPISEDLGKPLNRPEQISVARSFFECVDQYPKQTALTFQGTSLTYEELGTLVSEFMVRFRANSLKVGDRVAFEAENIPRLVACMLGCLALGGVIVPLDKSLPASRKQAMLEQAHATWLAHDGDVPNWLEEVGPINLIKIDNPASKVPHPSIIDEIFQPDPESPAYIFYTSGTTGKPKGIVGRHFGLSHFVNWQREQFNIGLEDRVSQLTSLSFDVVLRELFLPLTSGASLNIPDADEMVLSVNTLLWMKNERITVLHTVPSVLDSWLLHDPEDMLLPDLKWLFSAGEPLHSSLIMRWRGIAPNAKIINLYGPTETTLAKCWYEVPDSVQPGIQSIGRPIPDTAAIIMSDQLQPLGVGETGEIIIRTPFRSLGYLEPDDSDVQRFIQNPFRDDPNDLLYKTGDLGRYHTDGSLEILGRRDHQVKIRGVRIEPSMIENVLENHPEIEACRVVATTSDSNEVQLVAYVISQSRLSNDELYSYAESQLSAQMIPSAFVHLDSFPLTVNGKLDRNALPRPKAAHPPWTGHFSAPRDSTEKKLAAIFSEVLGIQGVGVNDNFFHLGGNSLKAVKAVNLIKKQFGKSISLASLFKSPSIVQLVKQVAEENRAEMQSPYSMLLAGNGNKTPLFFMPGIVRNALVLKELAECLEDDRVCFGLELPMPEDGEEQLNTVEKIASFCLDQIRTIKKTGPYYLAGFSFGGIIAYEVARQLYGSGEKVGPVFVFDSRHRVVGARFSNKARIAWAFNFLTRKPLGYIAYIIRESIIKSSEKFGIHYNTKALGPSEYITEELNPVITDPLHAAYDPEPFPLDLHVYNAKDTQYSIVSGNELKAWELLSCGRAQFTTINVHYHNQILNKENLETICRSMRQSLPD